MDVFVNGLAVVMLSGVVATGVLGAGLALGMPLILVLGWIGQRRGEGILVSGLNTARSRVTEDGVLEASVGSPTPERPAA